LEFETFFNRNRIFIERTSGVAAVDPETALNYSWSGPILRATGVDYDVRVNEPYSSYQDFDFEIPVGTSGDVYDRYIVRNEEMWQSLRIIEQALQKIEKENSLLELEQDLKTLNMGEYFNIKKDVN
jgi:NADH-quinone oxidoreductase subunit D